MRVLVTPDYRTLSQTAADIVLDAIRQNPALCLGLPTGRTPLGMYEELVKKYRDEHLDFSRITTFNLDEFIGLPQDHPKSYRSYMRRHFFDHVNIPAENRHIPDGSPGVDPAIDSELYEKEIERAGGIDLLVLGIGGNGHVGFNEPGSVFLSRTRAVDLTAETIANARQHFGSEPVPARAITMGIATILDARKILLIASGSSKAQVVQEALYGRMSEAVPGSALQLHGDVVVVLDKEAFRK